MEAFKTCTKCNVEKPLGAFRRGRTCKKCEVDVVRDWRAANPGRNANHCRNWIDKNRALARAAWVNYQGRKRTGTSHSDISNGWIIELKASSTHCPLCKVAYTYENPYADTYPNLDHVVPVAAGGDHVKDNVRYICRSCNIARPEDGSDLVNGDLS